MREINFNYLLASLIVLMFTGPVLHEYTLVNNPELLEMAFGAALILGVLSLIGDRREFITGLTVALFALICAAASFFLNLALFRYLMLGAGFVFFLLGIKYSARQVFLAGTVDVNKIVGAVCIFLLIAFLWAILFQFLEALTPGSFSGIPPGLEHGQFDRFVYFSLVTLTTLGYGDISPKTSLASILVTLEAVIGVFYIAILVAALVGDFMAMRKTDD
jgi:voltage-gated potassium channel Kch